MTVGAPVWQPDDDRESVPVKYLLPLLLLASLGAPIGCTPETSVFVDRDGGDPDPDPQPQAEPEPGVNPDMRLDMAVPVDMADPTDMPEVIDGGTEDVPDMAPPGEPPAREETIVLTNRDDGYIGWVRGGRLYSARLTEGAEAVDSVTDVADASSLTGRLRGYRLTGSRPYVVLPSGEGGALQAIDLKGQVAPTELEMYPPFDVFVDGEVLLVGQLGPEEDAQRGWRIIGAGNSLGPIYAENAGFGIPRSGARAMSGWVLGFDGPACLDMTRTAVLEAPWFCQGRPGARLVSDRSERLSFVGPTTEGIRMWQAMPAVSAAPEGPADPAQRVDLVQGSVIDWFPQPTGGQLAHITETDGGAETLWWIRGTQTDRAEISDPDTILGLSVIKSDIRLIRWDAEADRPVPAPVEFAAGPAPPVFEPALECNAYAADQCGGDLDCDGVVGSALCCRDISAHRISTRLPRAQEPDPRWFAGMSDVGLLLFVAVEGQGRLLRHPKNNTSGNEAQVVATWEGTVRVKHFANRVSRVVAHVDVVDADNPVAEGEPPVTVPALQWFSGPDGPSQTPTPCAEVLDLRILDGDGNTRVWCADGAVDLAHGAVMGEAIPYPEGTGALKWIESYALGDDRLYLVAHGDDHTLALWALDDDLRPQIAEQALPMEVALLNAEERTRPIRLPVVEGGRTARVADGALEVLEPGMGWQKVPGAAWPVSADISRFEPVALSAGFVAHPGSFVPGLGKIDYFLHSLQPDTQPWGQRYNPNQALTINEVEFHGVWFGNFPTGIGDPIFIAASGNAAAGNASVGFDATLITCMP